MRFLLGLGSVFILMNLPSTSLAQACIQQPSGAYYCPASYLIGAGNVVGIDMVSTLPSGNLTIQEKNLCPSSYLGGSLYQIIQFLQVFTNAALINGEIYGQWPPVAPPGSNIQTSGNTINTFGPPFPTQGRTVNFTGVFTPALYFYAMTCYYRSCTQLDPNNNTCSWNAPSYWIGINLPQQPPPTNLNLAVVQNAKAFTANPSQSTLVTNKFSLKPNKPTSIYVNVSGSGFNTPETRTANVSLKIGNNPLMTVPVSVASIQSAPGGVLPVSFSYTPTVAEAGEVSLSASISVAGDTNSSDDSFQSSMYVLCNVEDVKGKQVKFWYQGELRPGSNTSWQNDIFGNAANSNVPGKMQKYGCSVTDFAMLMDYYGIKKTPRGSPANPTLPGILNLPGLNGENLDPGYLNAAFANYLVNPLPPPSPLKVGSVALNSMNNPDWIGMAQVARAAYANQCASPSPLSCDPTKASTIISFVSYVQSFNNSNSSQDHKNIEYDLCRGNPVVLRFIKPNPADPANPGQHFMLATGMDVDANGNKIYTVNNPGTRQGQGKRYTDFLSRYPSITGYILYSSSADPSMMMITAPMNVHFVVTDTMGRRSGFDPNTNTTYNEIPGASYSNQSIDTPSDEGLPHETLVAERYFTYSSYSDIPNGSYSVQIYAINSGNYYLEYRGYDSNGNLNSNEIRNGVLNAGGSATQLLNHSNAPAPVINADLKVEHFMMRKKPKNSFAKTNLKIEGQLRRRDNKPISISNSVNISIGGSSGYKLNLFASDFKLRKSSEKSYYLYSKGDIEIKISTSGDFDINIENADLREIDRLYLGKVELQIDDAFGANWIQLECKKNACKMRGKGSFIKDDEE